MSTELKVRPRLPKRFPFEVERKGRGGQSMNGDRDPRGAGVSSGTGPKREPKKKQESWNGSRPAIQYIERAKNTGTGPHCLAK